MNLVALVLGYAVMVAGGVALVWVVWWKLLDLCYRYVVNTAGFFRVLVRYKQEQSASAERPRLARRPGRTR